MSVQQLVFLLVKNTLETKRFETLDAIQNGADEIDYVINITQLKEKNYTYIADEMHAVVDLCQENKKISKVIFETCYLSDAEKRELCRIVRDVRPDYVKTSTGFGSGGATLEDVALLLECVGDIAKVKSIWWHSHVRFCSAVDRYGCFSYWVFQ